MRKDSLPSTVLGPPSVVLRDAKIRVSPPTKNFRISPIFAISGPKILFNPPFKTLHFAPPGVGNASYFSIAIFDLQPELQISTVNWTLANARCDVEQIEWTKSHRLAWTLAPERITPKHTPRATSEIQRELDQTTYTVPMETKVSPRERDVV